MQHGCAESSGVVVGEGGEAVAVEVELADEISEGLAPRLRRGGEGGG